jgi:hypothetical protein
MREDNEKESHFKMRMDNGFEDPETPLDVDDMRLEKLNTRVTIISVMIPVLIVIVLVIAYLDIQKRVMHTEDTGSMSIQKISGDLESRFSSISLRQAQLEEELKRYIDSTGQSAARLEVRLTKMDDALKDARASLVGKKELNDAVAGLDNKLENVAIALDETKIQLDTIPGQLQTGLEQMRAAVAESNAQITGVEAILTRLGDEKIDKPSLDLAIRLENLKLEQLLKAQIGMLEDKVNRLERQVQAAAKPAPIQAVPVRPKPVAPDSAAPGAPADQSIQEQIIVQ